jgi:uncharacterized iron-regulated protein
MMLPMSPSLLKYPCIVLLVVAGALSGCRRESSALVDNPRDSRFGLAGFDQATQTALGRDDYMIQVRDSDEQLPVFDGITAEPMTGRRVIERIRAADVVILGETHTDPMAHRLQVRFVREALAMGNGALSLEMITRDHQAAASRVRNRPGAAEALLAETSLNTWPHWRTFYLPVIEAAAAMDRPIVAANAPSQHVRLARNEGHEALRDLDREEQRLFDLPEPGSVYPDYRRRFEATMSTHGGVQPATRPTTQPTTRSGRERLSAHAPQQPQTRPATTRPATRPGVIQPATRPGRTPRDPMSPAAFYDAQLVWDATMARSIMMARARHGSPVVHLVGSFHSDFDGGLTSMLRERGLDVVTVSFVPDDAQRLRSEDVGRADIVIYTGADRPLPPERAPATRPTTRPQAPVRTPPTATTRPTTRGAVTRPTTRRSGS